MSTDSAKTVKRQWHSVRFLLRGNYVSSAEIKAYLAAVGIVVDLRTIQRDLRILQTIFPLECREDSMPHSWRWKRAEDTAIGELNLSQALTLRLVEEQLGKILSPKLIQQLEPMFEKAKVIVGMELEDLLIDKPKDIKKLYAHRATKGTPVIFGSIVAKIGSIFANSQGNTQVEADRALHELVSFLQLDEDLEELARDFKS